MKDQNPRTQLDLNIIQNDKNTKISKYQKKKNKKTKPGEARSYPLTSQWKLRRASDDKL